MFGVKALLSPKLLIAGRKSSIIMNRTFVLSTDISSFMFKNIKTVIKNVTFLIF